MRKFLFLLIAAFYGDFSAEAARLIFRLKPEFRLAPGNAGEDVLRFWSSLGLPAPERCFPKHAPRFSRAEKAFGPTDLSLLFRVNVPDPLKTAFLMGSVRRMPWAEWAEWASDDALPLSMPDDPGADSLSGTQRQVLRKIRAYQAWNISRGDSSVAIGILDTGTPVGHEDIAGNLFKNWADPVNGIDDDGNGLTDDFNGWDFGGNDNNPTPDNTGTSPGHGTSVSSLASASTDNATGIAGIGWKCRILPVKIWSWNGSFGNFSGYEAIVYAADMGCRVITCSWGSPGSGSRYEQEIIRYATFNKGALVVAAGGNTAGYYQFLPANYDYAFGVSMTDTSDRIFWAASRHFKLDLMAPGVGVYGIKTNNSYGWVEGGTSMASPMVAGAAGLVLSKYPFMNGLQAGELLRVNSDTIYSITGNAGYRDQTGRGRLNIERALLRENRISVRAVECIPSGLARPGDTLRLALRFENYLDSISGYSVKLFSGSAELNFLQNSASFGPLGTMQDFRSGMVFSAIVNPALAGRKEVSIRAEVRSGNYLDSRLFSLQLNPGWLILDTNEVEITLAENGRFGYADLAGYLGNGIRYRQVQMTADAGLMLGTGPDKVSDCVFSGPSNNLNFKGENRFQYAVFQGLDQHAVFHFNDSLAGSQASGLGIKQSAYESDDDSLRACAFVSYQVSNRNSFALDSLCLGLYNDWETGNPDRNFCGWNDSLQFVYTRPAGSGKIAATMVLGSGEPQAFAIDAVPDTSGNNINLFDGFSKAEKWKTLNSRTARSSAGGSSGRNVVQVCGMKWRNLLPGETRKLGFAFLFADSIPELIKKAKAGRAFFTRLNTGRNPFETWTDFCDGDTIPTLWQGAKKIAVFSDSLGLNPVYEGPNNFQASVFSDTAWYVSSRDSLFPAPLEKIQYRKWPLPEVFLSCSNCPAGDTVQTGSSLQFSVSGSPGIIRWYKNGVLQSVAGDTCCPAFTAEQSGSFEICAEIAAFPIGCGRRVCREFTVLNVTSSGTSSDLFSLFPNPAGDEVQLHSAASGKFILCDLRGWVVFEKPVLAGTSRMVVSGLPAGFYQWKLETRTGIQTGRLIKN